MLKVCSRTQDEDITTYIKVRVDFYRFKTEASIRFSRALSRVFDEISRAFLKKFQIIFVQNPDQSLTNIHVVKTNM